MSAPPPPPAKHQRPQVPKISPPLVQSVWDIGHGASPPLAQQAIPLPDRPVMEQLPLLQEFRAAYSRLRAAVATCYALVATRGQDDDLSQVMLDYIRRHVPYGWTLVGFEGEALYWRDTELNYTTWRVPDRPAGVTQELLEPLQQRIAAGVEPPPPPP